MDLTTKNTIFIDESTIKATKNAPLSWQLKVPGLEKRGLVGRYSHPLAVHVIGGISRRGATKLIIFNGNMNARGFAHLADDFLVPFIRRTFPISHTLHMDNSPVHTSRRITNYINRNGINHFMTPAESPDINPIELVWNDLKYFIARTVKPDTKQQLIDGILFFWRNAVTVQYCYSKINHINRVLRVIVNIKGKATGL